MRLHHVILSAAVLALSCPLALADIPRQVNFQGVLSDNSGTPMPDDTLEVTFTIYDKDAGGTSLWTEVDTVTTDAAGRFTILMGLSTPIPASVFTNSARWLGITVATDPELAPRIKLASVPYSYMSDSTQATFGSGGGGWTDDGNVVRLDSSSDSVGIGISSPSAKLEVAGDILVAGKGNIGIDNSNPGTGAFVAGTNDTASGEYATIGGGRSNRADSLSTTVGGGENNTADGIQSVIAGGRNNTASGENSTVAGGFGNAASGQNAAIGGGAIDTASGFASVIGGGISNTASGIQATIGGGASNTVTNENATIGGGFGNLASGRDATIAGGAADTASGQAATVGGGNFNQATGVGSTIGGGLSNLASGDYATIGGGAQDSATGNRSTVGGGEENTASGDWSTVGGGLRDTASAVLSTVAGGGGNWAGAQAATVGGGQENVATGLWSTVAGGGGFPDGNAATASWATVGGGNLDTASASYATVSGGNSNTASGSWSSVAGGSDNTASGDYSMIPGGSVNVAAGSYAFAAGLRAQTLHERSFVWSGAIDTGTFASTAAYQFLVNSDFAGFGRNFRITPAEVFGIRSPSTSGFGGMYVETSGSSGRPFYGYAHAGTAGAYHYQDGFTGTWTLSNSGDRLAVTIGGNVGIGTLAPNYKLDVRGTIGNNVTLYHSDRRWKRSIKTLDRSLAKVQRLRGVSYEWRREEFTDMNFPTGQRIGLIAQEVEEVLPELVDTNAEGYKSVEYANLVAVLIEAVKELNTTVQQQQKQIDQLLADQLSKPDGESTQERADLTGSDQ